MARSTFKVLFYVNGSKEKNGIVPIMGRVTINGTVAQFSCKRTIPKELWDAQGNKAKGKSMKARETNLALDNIKAQIIKHYQRISDREAFVTAEMVHNAFQGIGNEYETLLNAFDRENEVFRKRVGKDRTMATYRSRVVERNTNFILARKLPDGKNAKELARVVILLLLPYIGKIRSITTDNGSEFAGHKTITQRLRTKIFFAHPYASWKKGRIEYHNKLIRQSIPKGADFNAVSDLRLKDIVAKINRRPREKLRFSSPVAEFFKFIS